MDGYFLGMVSIRQGRRARWGVNKRGNNEDSDGLNIRLSRIFFSLWTFLSETLTECQNG